MQLAGVDWVFAWRHLELSGRVARRDVCLCSNSPDKQRRPVRIQAHNERRISIWPTRAPEYEVRKQWRRARPLECCRARLSSALPSSWTWSAICGNCSSSRRPHYKWPSIWLAPATTVSRKGVETSAELTGRIVAHGRGRFMRRCDLLAQDGRITSARSLEPSRQYVFEWAAFGGAQNNKLIRPPSTHSSNNKRPSSSQSDHLAASKRSRRARNLDLANSSRSGSFARLHRNSARVWRSTAKDRRAIFNEYQFERTADGITQRTKRTPLDGPRARTGRRSVAPRTFQRREAGQTHRSAVGGAEKAAVCSTNIIDIEPNARRRKRRLMQMAAFCSNPSHSSELTFTPVGIDLVAANH